MRRCIVLETGLALLLIDLSSLGPHFAHFLPSSAHLRPQTSHIKI